MFYVTFVLTVLLHVWRSAHFFLEVLYVTRVSTAWPNLSKAEKTLNHLTPAGQHFQFERERGHKAPVRDLCRRHWSLEEKYWWPDNSELCESCHESQYSAPLVWYRSRSGSGLSPPVRRCPSGPGFDAGNKCSVVSGPHHQNCFQRYHWATNSCSKTNRKYMHVV